MGAVRDFGGICNWSWLCDHPFVRPGGPSLRPDLALGERRAQTPSRLAAGHRRRRREAALTALSTARPWRQVGTTAGFIAAWWWVLERAERGLIRGEPAIGREGSRRNLAFGGPV